nr:hypothetical protein [Tanacetum cinerariifolium]
MPIPGRLITANIREASYYQEYQENVAKHRGFLAGETGSTQDLPAPKPAKPARKPQSTTQKAPPKPLISSSITSTQPAPTSAPAKSQENKRKQATGTTNKPAKSKRIKRSVSRKTRQPRRSPKSVGASEAEEVPVEEPQAADEDADYQKAVEESMKDAYALPKGPFPPVVIREPESGKYQPLPEVPGKGKAKVSEEQVAHNLLSLQKHKKTSPTDQYIFQGESSNLLYPPSMMNPHMKCMDNQTARRNQKRLCLGLKRVVKMKAGSNPDETSEGQAGPDPGNAEARVQSTTSPVVHAGSDRDHMDLDVANVSPQPSTEQLDEGFTATVYLNVQENLKLAIKEPVLPESPKEHQQLKATTTDTTTTTTTLPPPQAPQQSTTEAMMVKRIGELEHILAYLIQVNKTMKERLDKHGARLYTLEQLDIPQQVSIAELAHDLAEARKKRKKGRESPKMPPGSPSHQPPPPPPLAGSSETSGAPRASGSQVTPPPPPPTSTNQDSLSKGSATLSPSKTRVEDFQLGIESYQTQVNLTKPQWTATSFEYNHDYTVIESPRAVIFQDKYVVQMMMGFNKIHKFSDGTLQQIVEALDYRVKEFRINRMNPGLNTRFWTKKDVDQCNAFMFAIQRRLRTRRIFHNLESFIGGRIREGDYRLLRRTD